MCTPHVPVDMNASNDQQLDRFVQPLSPEQVGKALSQPRGGHPQKAEKGMFLKGPVPLRWLERAAASGGKCLTLGVVLWLLRGLKRKSVFALEHKWCTRLGMGRRAVRDSLSRLEAEGLISVERRNGRCPRVTVLADGDSEVATKGLPERRAT